MYKKFLKSAMLIALAGSMVGGATLALWTASATVPGNTATATELTVSVERDNGDTPPGPMFYTVVDEGNPGAKVTNATGLWYPGKTKARLMTVKNTNSQIKLGISKIKFNIDQNSVLPDDTDPAVYSPYDEYLDKMMFKVYYDFDVDVDGKPISILLAEGTLEQFMQGFSLNPTDTEMLPGGFINLRFVATLSKEAGDQLKNVKPIVDFSLTSTQVN